jgi:hypothetical protein
MKKNLMQFAINRNNYHAIHNRDMRTILPVAGARPVIFTMRAR